MTEAIFKWLSMDLNQIAITAVASDDTHSVETPFRLRIIVTYRRPEPRWINLDASICVTESMEDDTEVYRVCTITDNTYDIIILISVEFVERNRMNY